MIEALPIEWLVDQHVPLIFFLLALLSEPATWSKRIVNLLHKRFDGIERGSNSDQ